jgi:hypothetical protein
MKAFLVLSTLVFSSYLFAQADCGICNKLQGTPELPKTVLALAETTSSRSPASEGERYRGLLTVIFTLKEKGGVRGSLELLEGSPKIDKLNLCRADESFGVIEGTCRSTNNLNFPISLNNFDYQFGIFSLGELGKFDLNGSVKLEKNKENGRVMSLNSKLDNFNLLSSSGVLRDIETSIRSQLQDSIKVSSFFSEVPRISCMVNLASEDATRVYCRLYQAFAITKK